MNRNDFLHKQLDQYNIVSTTDTHGVIIYANDKFCEVAKYRREELIGKSHKILNSGKHSKAFFSEMWATISKGNTWRGEICNKSKDGTLYWGDSFIIPEMDSEGLLQYYHSFKIIITDRKKIEEELYKTKTHLEEQLAEDRILNKILSNSSSKENVSDFLNASVELLADGSHLKWLTTMAVFTTQNNNKTLNLESFQNLSNTIVTDINCSLIEKNEVSIIKNEENIDFEKWIEEIHLLNAVQDQYINIPISYKNDPFGFLIVYLPDDFEITQKEVQFLNKVASLFANKIKIAKNLNHLKESEQKYRTLYNTTPAMYFSIDEKGSVISANAFASVSLGYNDSDLVGKHVTLFLEQSIHKQVQTNLNKCFEFPNDTQNWEVKLLKKNGTHIYVNTTAWVEETLEGGVFIRVICKDITQRKSIQNTLKAERELLINGPTVVFQWLNEEGWPSTYVSPNVASIFGYSTKDFMDQQVLYEEVIHPDDKKLVKEAIEKWADSKEKNFVQEYRIIKKGGEQRWVRDHSTITRDRNGIICFYTGHVYDITEYYHASDETEMAKARLISLIEAIPDAIFFKDGNSKWLITNDAAKKLFKLHEIDWQGKLEMELAEMRPEFSQAHKDCLITDEQAWAAKKITFFTEFIEDDFGNMREYEVRKVPNFNPDGSRKALVIIGSDVTERKEKEKELQKKNEKLEEVAWVFSHQVRAPVATIKGLTNVFNFNNIGDPINNQVLSRIKQPVDNLDEIISYIVGKTNELDDEFFSTVVTTQENMNP
ncbi:MAG: PAS domain S-box protein [Cyclobacteriaceae bacterium]|nr:PAS domain S-box protein [Cyclobacteriaceae bacterium]